MSAACHTETVQTAIGGLDFVLKSNNVLKFRLSNVVNGPEFERMPQLRQLIKLFLRGGRVCSKSVAFFVIGIRSHGTPTFLC